MKFIDNLIAGIAPGFAIKRMQARQSIKAFYEATKTTRLHTKRTDTRSADGVNKPALDILRTNARHLEENHDLAKGVLNVLVDNIVGLGIRPEPQVKTNDGEFATDVNQQLLDLWREWIRKPEVTWELDYYSAQRLMCRTWLRDGEVLIQHLEGNVRGLNHGTLVPYSLELLEPDFLPVALDDGIKNIVQGVEKDAWGRPKFYHIYKQHPGDNGGMIVTQDTKRVNANRITHIKNMDRIKQTRGISIFASIYNRLDDIKEIEESERTAARVAAAMSGFIKKGSPELYVPPANGDDYREMDFVPGMIFDDLMIGEDIQSIASNRPNSQVNEFRNSQLRAAASGTGASYSSISKDYGGTFSSQRQELVEAHTHYGTLWHYYSEQETRPTYERFATMATTAGLIDITDDVDTDTLLDVGLSQPAMPWVDPVKEMKALREAIEIKVKSRSAAIRERGGNPDEVKKQIESETQGEEVEPTEEEINEQTEEELEQENVKRFVMSVIDGDL